VTAWLSSGFVHYFSTWCVFVNSESVA